MKEKLLTGVKFLVFLTISCILFWWVYKDQNPDEIINALKNIDYFWIWLSMLFGLLSHFSRAMRWNLLIEPLGYRPKVLNTFFAVMIMYLANLAFPRFGEVSRVGILKKYEKIPFRKLLGTVIIERTSDFFMTFIFLGIVLLTQLDVIIEFFRKNPELSKKLDNLPSVTSLIIIGIVFIIILLALFVLIKKYFSKNIFFLKIADFLKQIIEGVKTIKNMEKKYAFIAHTIFIWIMYFMMLYIVFYTYESMSQLTILMGLTVMVMGSFGMIAPVQGGIGAWHFMTIETLIIYGINTSEAKIFALIMHGSMTLMLIVAGFLSLIALPIYNKNRKV